MIRDQETINQLVDIIERFVRERLIPAEEQMAEEGKLPDHLHSSTVSFVFQTSRTGKPWPLVR